MQSNQRGADVPAATGTPVSEGEFGCRGLESDATGDILGGMRQIGTLTTEPHARRLVDFLLTSHIKSQADPADNGWAIWVYDEDRIADAQAILARFSAAPDAPEFAEAQRAAAKLRSSEAARERAVRKQVVDVRTRWSASRVAGRPLTILLIVASVAVSMVTRFGEEDEEGSLMQHLTFVSYSYVDAMHILPGSDLRKGELWRLVTPIFLHFNLMHIAFNSISMLSVGSVIEMRWGTRRLLALTVLIAVFSNSAQYFMKGPQFGGLSGVVFGLFGYLWMKSRFDPSSGIQLSAQSVTWMLFFLALCMTGALGSIANAAHLVGLLTGVVLGYAPVGWRRLTRRSA